MSGIYLIENRINKMVYVGSSSSINARWDRHKSRLKSNKHHNAHLQNAWNKYGADQFAFEVIEECPSEVLIEREQFWFDYYKQSGTYNIGDFVNSPHRGKPLSQGHKSRIGEANKGRSINARVWKFVDPEGNNVTIENLLSFCKDKGLNVGNMNSVAKGRRSSCNGWTRGKE